MVQTFLSDEAPLHVAIAMTRELLSVDLIERLLAHVQARHIPLLTIGFPDEDDPEFLDLLENIFTDLVARNTMNDRQVKLSVLGKWYRLPDRIIQPIKQLTESTRDFDKFFLTLLVRYDGYEEIAAATALLAKQALLGRLDPDSISPEDIKENMYTAGRLSPELIIVLRDTLDGFLLWDSRYAYVYFHNKDEFTETDFDLALAWLKKRKN